MASRLELLRKGFVEKSNSIDAVFLRNKVTAEIGGDDVMMKPYSKSDLVYICISTTAKAISQVPLLTVDVFNKGGIEQHKPLPFNDPWQTVWTRPNYMTDRYSFTESIISYLLLDGRAHVIPFPPLISGKFPPQSLWVVRKKFMKPKKDPRTGHLLGWWFNPSSNIVDSAGNPAQGTVLLNPEEVANIFLFNPDDPYEGMAPIEAGKLNIVVDYKASVYTSVFFDEGAQPGGVLQTTQKLGDKQFTRTREQMEARHQGYRKAHRMMVLEQGLKYTQTGLSQRDMEFPSLRDLSAERIYQIFGMKKAIISVTEDVNYATSREQKKGWWEDTNIPLMSMVASALSFTLFREQNRKVIFDHTTIAALQEALKDKLDTAYKLWQMGYTANEINARLDLGFEEKPWRNKWYMPVNLVPVDESGEIPIAPAETPPRSIASKDARNEQIWTAVMNRLSPLEEIFSKKVSRVFFDMRKRTLELLYKDTKATKAPKDVDEDTFSDEVKAINKLTDPLYQNALLVGVATFTEESGLSIAFDLSDPEAISFLTNKNLQIRNVVQTIKNQIRAELIDAYEKGESIDQISERIKSVFNVATSRTKAIARTEIVGAANEGRAVAINRSGFKKKEWFTAMDERVRPQHSYMHARQINVGEVWVFPDGSSVRHPGDYNGPAHQIINCRCVEVVVPGTHYLNN